MSKVLRKVGNENMKSNVTSKNHKPNVSNSIQTKSLDIGIKQNEWDCKTKMQFIAELFHYCNEKSTEIKFEKSGKNLIEFIDWMNWRIFIF